MELLKKTFNFIIKIEKEYFSFLIIIPVSILLVRKLIEYNLELVRSSIFYKGLPAIFGSILLIYATVIVSYFLHEDFRKKSFHRGAVLILLVLIELLLILAFWSKINELLKDAKWLQSIAFSLFAGVPAFCLWYWRNEDKLNDQDHMERDLIIKEEQHDWKTFFDLMDIVENPDSSENKKSSAIYALGQYYYKNKKFTKQVHNFFKKHLNNFGAGLDSIDEDNIHDEYDAIEIENQHFSERPHLGSSKLKNRLPIIVKSIHEVLHELFLDKNFDFKDYDFLSQIDLRYINLSNVKFSNIKFKDTNFDYANFDGCFFDNCSLEGESNFYKISMDDVIFHKSTKLENEILSYKKAD